MLSGLFESNYTRTKDLNEINSLRRRFGEQLSDVIRERIKSATTDRDRKHWQRIARKI